MSPRSTVNGWIVVSCSSRTVGSIHVVRVDDGDPVEHVRGEDAVAQHGGGRRELEPGVHALRLGRIACKVHRDLLPGGRKLAHGVGEVELPLGVGGVSRSSAGHSAVARNT